MAVRLRRFAGLFTAFALLVAIASPAAAQDDLPPASAIIQKYIDALGGTDALKSMATVKGTGKIDVNGQQFDFVAYYGPQRFYRKMDFPNDAVYEQGYNGEVAWEKNPSMGNRKLEGAEKADFVRRMDHLDMLTWSDFPGKITTKAKDISVRGVNCYQVDFDPKEGNSVSRYFAQDSGLLIKVATILESPNGPVAVDIFYDDYKDFQSGKMSMKRTQEIGQGVISFTFEKVEVLDKFPAEFEKVPAEVQDAAAAGGGQ